MHTATTDQLVESITRGLDELSRHVDAVAPAIARSIAAGRPPPWVEEALRWCGDRIVEDCAWFLRRLREALEGAAAPALFLACAYRWETLRGRASTAAGLLDGERLPATGLWHGPAASAYQAAVRPQAAAAARVAVLADRTATALSVSAAAGIAFYVCLSGIVAEVIATAVAAVAALGSEVFSWAGILLVLGEFAVSRAALVAASGGLAVALSTQAAQLAGLHGEAVDDSVFPGGSWPDPVVARYADATVADGDADWSLLPR